MSLLAPLYALGALAVALPVIFHLIRRQVKNRTPVSSVMFLPTSEPRLSRRSRLENLPLLILRGLALLILAIAFSRPFLRTATSESGDGVRRRVIALIDTSASMRRDDLWQQAVTELRQLADGLAPDESLAVVSFDAQPRLQIGFDADALPEESRQRLADLLFIDAGPSWHHTDLAAALRFAADLATVDSAAPTGNAATDPPTEDDPSVATPATIETRIVLISDLQAGAELESLPGFAWPKTVPVELRRVRSQRPTNAWVTLPSELPSDPAADESAADQRLRLRVDSTADSVDTQFRLSWLTASGVVQAGAAGEATAAAETNEAAAVSDPLSVQVAPGRSRIVRVPRPPAAAIAIELAGDDHDFDNVRYYVTEPPRQQTLWLIGDDADEPRDSLFFYPQRLTFDTAARTVTFRRFGSDGAPLDDTLDTSGGPLEISASDSDTTPLIFASGSLAATATESLLDYVRRGGRLVYVLPAVIAGEENHAQAALRALTGSDEIVVGEAAVRDYAMLSRIDFTHPLFAPLADPQFNDFSKIRFWAHRTVAGLADDWRVLATLDDGSPAIVEHRLGDGRIWLFTAGWQPRESQLALSTKFIPLMFGLLDVGKATPPSPSRYLVGDRFPQLTGPTDESVEIRRLVGSGDEPWQPLGRATEPAASRTRSGDASGDRESPGNRDQGSAEPTIDRPGVYRITRGEQSQTIAANLAPAESLTEPLGEDELERAGVVLGKPVSAAAAESRQRQLRDIELESQQRLWHWLLIAVLGLLAAETLLGGLLGRTPARQTATRQ